MDRHTKALMQCEIDSLRNKLRKTQWFVKRVARKGMQRANVEHNVITVMSTDTSREIVQNYPNQPKLKTVDTKETVEVEFSSRGLSILLYWRRKSLVCSTV